MAVPAAEVAVDVDSGARSAPGAGSDLSVVFSQILSVQDASWVRLHFSDVTFSGSRAQGNEAILRVTSLEDGAVQILDSDALGTWASSTAYFNGDAVLLELLAYPGTGNNRVAVDMIGAGEQGAGGPAGGPCYTDDRVQSYDPRAARVFWWEILAYPRTAWSASSFLIDRGSRSFLTAGHCCDGMGFDVPNYPFSPVVEFNVPDSSLGGSIKHPGPEDQYPLDKESLQFDFYLLPLGLDWCYFGVFDNTTTGLTPVQAQGATYRLADEVPEPDDSTLRMEGYGWDQPPHMNLSGVQQTAAGLYQSLEEDPNTIARTLGYSIYTIGGASGSPVWRGSSACNAVVYAIHTNGTCDEPEHRHNHGTAIDQQDLQAALANPRGVCADCNENGIPDDQDIAGGTSTDCNGNGLPDECEPDCNGNGVADRCDIDAGTSADVNENHIPDDCEHTLFVDPSAPHRNNGSSWNNAYTDLQSALDHSDPCGLDIEEIWVAQGVYTPAACQTACDAGSPERDESFQLPFGVILYGGFPAGGGDGTLQARSPVDYPTVLSGDLNGDDGPGFANNDENSRHVVRTAYADSVLDGFHVVGGNANGTGADGVGGGITLQGDSTVVNCIVRGNSASSSGAGMYANAGSSTVVNCLFTGNEATNYGAGLYDYSSSLTVRNCTFSGNSTSPSGLRRGAGIAYSGTSPTVRNCVLWGNSVNGETDESAQIYVVFGGDPSIEYSCVQGWTGALGGAGNIGSDPVFVDADGGDDLFGTADDNVRLSLGSPSIDAGKNYSGIPETTDLDGNPRRVDDPMTDDIGWGTAPIADMGAYEYYTDCNSNDIHDPFDPMDWDAEGDVDLADFAGLQECFGETTVECLAAFDRAGECDLIGADDYAVFAWQLTGPAGQTAQSATAGGPGDQGLTDVPDGALGITSPGDETAQGEADPASGPVDTSIAQGPDVWIWVEHALTLEVRPVGGGKAVSTLAPNTTYELHYQADSAGVLYYVLWGVGTSPDMALTALRPASSGPWADTGNFFAYDLLDTGEDPIPASGYPGGYYYSDLALDQGLASSEGYMCNFTTGQGGTLGLEVYMEGPGASPRVQLMMEAQASFPVR